MKILARLCLAAAIAGAFGATAAASAGATPTARLLTSQTARAYPGHGAPAIASISSTRPLTGQPTVLPVIGGASAAGRSWLRVRLPKRPNGQTGWISSDGVVSGNARYRIVVSRRARTATIYRGRRAIRRVRVVVGARSTPTPAGHFFIAERVRQPHGSAIGGWALATSAYSNVLQSYGGGPGQIALHGRAGLRSDPLGSARSHGCIRFADSVINWLARRAGAGTTVTVR